MSNANLTEKREAGTAHVGESHRERHKQLIELQRWLETPMVVLAFAWLAMLVMELILGESFWIGLFVTIIWVIFLLDFALEFTLAPVKSAYLRRNWLTAFSLLIPALRIFRIARVVRLLRLARIGRGLRLVRVVSSLNRGMKALGASLRRRGFGYVLALTTLVTFTGAAGMYAFEKDVPGGPTSYGESLWWTAMVMTTMGSQYWPQSAEGRVLCVILALYAFAVFGYTTATLATFFVGRDAERAGAKQIALLRSEVAALRDDIRALSLRPPAS